MVVVGVQSVQTSSSINMKDIGTVRKPCHLCASSFFADFQFAILI